MRAFLISLGALAMAVSVAPMRAAGTTAPTARDVNPATAFMRSGPSLLPRGDFGPTLAVAEPGAPVPASNGSRVTLQDR